MVWSSPKSVVSFLPFLPLLLPWHSHVMATSMAVCVTSTVWTLPSPTQTPFVVSPHSSHSLASTSSFGLLFQIDLLFSVDMTCVSGTWTGNCPSSLSSLPSSSCSSSCPPPPHPPAGASLTCTRSISSHHTHIPSRNTTSFSVGDVCRHSCDSGHGSTLMVCQRNGMWEEFATTLASNEAISCQVSPHCPPHPLAMPGAFSNGNHVCDAKSCRFVCDAGHHMIAGSDLSFCSWFGAWSEGVGTCVPNKRIPESSSPTDGCGQPSDAGIDVTVTCSEGAGSVGSWCQYECRSGYTMAQGQSTRMCQVQFFILDTISISNELSSPCVCVCVCVCRRMDNGVAVMLCVVV